jgi:single-stranded DNA-binding protein
VTLQFWDDLALVASEHVKKGDRIFVSGRLVSDTVDEGPEKRHVYYKVLSLLGCSTCYFHCPTFL